MLNDCMLQLNQKDERIEKKRKKKKLTRLLFPSTDCSVSVLRFQFYPMSSFHLSWIFNYGVGLFEFGDGIVLIW